jgi:putative N6-adenine-specific DNA methylase
MKAVNTATLNVKAAGLTKDITVSQQDFKDFQKPAEKALMVTNPPYGERISTPNLLGTYKMIGERLKHAFGGNTAWILSYREECFEQIGLKPSIKIPLYNGSLECEFRKYAMFEGKMKEFREEGGIVKTEEELKEMAQKRRFKKHRDFKQRLTEDEENAENDIRSFTFHSFEKDHLGRTRVSRSSSAREDEGKSRWPKERRSEGTRGRSSKGEERGARRERRRDDKRGGKPFNKKSQDRRRMFSDEE